MSVCVSKVTENLLTLSPLYRDYWGEQMAAYTRWLDGFSKLGCYVPRFYHAPDSESQFVGVPSNGYKTYLLKLPLGSWILGFLHSTSSVTGSAAGSGPVISVPPNASGFRAQITDLSIDHKWFSHPIDEAYFINDNLLGPSNAAFPYPNNSLGFTFPSFPRLLPVPYPVVPPGQFQVEFWNLLNSNGGIGANTDIQLTFLVLVPEGGVSGK